MNKVANIMRLHPRVAVVVALIVALLLPLSASAATKLTISAKASPTSIAAKDGTVTLKVLVSGAVGNTTCTFSSTPAVSRFAGTVKCSKGTLTRSGKLGKNSGKARTVELKVTVKNSTTSATATATIRQFKAKRTTTSATTTTTPTITSLPPGPLATVVVNIIDGHIIADGLAIWSDGLPAPPAVDAFLGHNVDLDAFVNEPNTAGDVAFYLNGQEISGCGNVAVTLNATTTQSEATCEYEFASGGAVTLSAAFVGADRSQGTAQRTFTVASSAEESILLQECAEAATMFSHCT